MPDKEPTHSLRLFVGWADMAQDCYLRDYKRAQNFVLTGLPVQARATQTMSSTMTQTSLHLIVCL